MDQKINVKMYKGMPPPTVELSDDELPAEAAASEEIAGDALADVTGGIGVSLDNLESDAHNQSYGMAQGSTGCISNPGGPSC